MARGIQNVTGVSCHISCALQLLAHCVSPLVALYKQDILPVLSQSSCTGSISDDLVEELGRVLCALTATEYQQDGSSSPLDPGKLYDLLERQASLNPQDVGDVSTAVFKLWQILSTNCQEWKDSVDYLVLGGQTRQVITGTSKRLGSSVENDASELITRIRRKLGKVKRMACPFPLSFGVVVEDGQALVENALRDLCQVSGGTQLEGYDWESQPIDCYTTEERVDYASKDTGRQSVNDNDWSTTKSIQMLQAPRYLFLTLERFSYTVEGERIWKHPRIEIPPQLDVPDFGCGSASLQLKGGVLHVSGDSIDEEGHYVTLVLNHSSSSVEQSWTLIDDDTCRSIDSETALRWLSGANDESCAAYHCAVLVVYGPYEEVSGATVSLEWFQSVAKLREHYGRFVKEKEAISIVDWSQPEMLVGRRLKVRWGKGKFYEGVVENFDITVGKHTIRYNDGDVREYVLCKKTIEWL
jgi:hypothetical protein